MESIENLVGQNIRARRKRLGLNQSDLASASSMTVQAINRIERGKALPRGPNLEAIARALGCAPSELYETPRPEADADPGALRRLLALVTTLDETQLESVLKLVERMVAAGPGARKAIK